MARNFSLCVQTRDYDGDMSFACNDDLSRDVLRRRGECMAPRFSFAEQSVKSRGTTLIESSSEHVSPRGQKFTMQRCA